MKAIRKSDGMVIDVDVYDEQVSWVSQVKTTYVDIDHTELYQESDLDFFPEKETEVIEECISKMREKYNYMNKTKDQQAQEYAEKKDRALRKAWHIYRYGEIKEGDDWENDPIKPFGNFEEGFNAGVSFFEQSQWRSVEEELPEDEETVLTYSNYGPVLAYYSEQDKMWFAYGNYGDINPTHWMPITPPSLSDTNTEKK